MPPSPSCLRLPRRNDHPDLTRAISVVEGYMPALDLTPRPSSDISTTVVSAFFPPPAHEPLMRKVDGKPFTRDTVAYIEGLKLMAATCNNIVLFLPAGDLEDEIRAATDRHGVKVYDHFGSVWDLPNLKGRKSEFYVRQVRLDREGGTRKGAYGEPHSWGTWNAKAFLVLEAMSLNPFKTSHFLWLDVRLPFLARTQVDGGAPWPHLQALQGAYSVMQSPDRAVVCGMRPLRPVGTAFWPVIHENGAVVDAYMEDIHAICANIYFGSKVAMARLAKAQLSLMERDFLRGYYVGREEFQLSYLHFEFPDLTYVLELFSQKPYPLGVYWYTFAYWYMSKPHDWRNIGLEADPITDDDTESGYL